MGSAERMEAVGAESAPLCDPSPGPLDVLGGTSGLPLLNPVDPNRLGVRLLPDVRAKVVVVRLTSQQPIEDILHGDEDVEVVAMRTTHERHESVIEVDEQVLELIPQGGPRLSEKLLGHHVHPR